MLLVGQNAYSRQDMHFCLENSSTQPNTYTNIHDARMTILSDGKIGIGTRTPFCNLDVNATTITRGSIMNTGSLVKSFDKRIKKKIIPTETVEDLSIINALVPKKQN